MREQGLRVSVFKKGPDYIDSAWLGAIGGTTCRNLDTYMVEPEVVRARFFRSADGSDVALLEGNRGLFDGKDARGTHSTAELSRLLRAPVILVVNASKRTRTAAALVHGCRTYEPDLRLGGVILNNVGGNRHQRVITESMEMSGIPVLGCLGKLGGTSAIIPGRHLGLVPPDEQGGREALVAGLLELARNSLDINAILDVARSAEAVDIDLPELPRRKDTNLRIGYFRDSAFSFYYPENIEALEQQGAKLIAISSISDQRLPDVHGLYIGGGFPETHADLLSSNRSLASEVRDASERGMPIYAECGGLIYLCRSLQWKGITYQMSGVFPIDLMMSSRPAGHGYTKCRVDRANPFFASGEIVMGHEFHYSHPVQSSVSTPTCMQVEEGTGLGGNRDGLLHRSSLASYTHIHADSVPRWSERFVESAATFRMLGENARESRSLETFEGCVGRLAVACSRRK
jgi:cobyrinic acid a,c-diamide synthase